MHRVLGRLIKSVNARVMKLLLLFLFTKEIRQIFLIQVLLGMGNREIFMQSKVRQVAMVLHLAGVTLQGITIKTIQGQNLDLHLIQIAVT